MIIIRLWGGLGNQLFQYAYGYSMAKKLNTHLKLDISYFDNQPDNLNRLPKILNLNIQEKEQLEELNSYKNLNLLKSRQINRLIRIPKKSIFFCGGDLYYLKESRFEYTPFFQQIKKENLYIDGYWQCEEYFIDVRQDLLAQYQAKIENDKFHEIKEQMGKNNSVAVHIRRGDYVGNRNIFSNLYELKASYYHESMTYMESKIDNPEYYLFSDDIEWVRSNLGEKENFHYIDSSFGFADYEELLLMSCCKNQIIANSTFSWWAAWLNENPNKIVIAPSRWFGNRNIIPSSWIKIKSQDK